jgi:hypothetical protein
LALAGAAEMKTIATRSKTAKIFERQLFMEVSSRVPSLSRNAAMLPPENFPVCEFAERMSEEATERSSNQQKKKRRRKPWR